MASGMGATPESASDRLFGPSRRPRFDPLGHRWAVTSTRQRHSPVATVVLLMAAVVGLFALERVAVGSARGQRLDDSAMHTVWAGSPALRHLHSYLGNITVGTTALALLVCVVLAAVRGRHAIAAGAVVLVAGSNLTTQFLKTRFFERPDFGFATINSFPSGHTTVAISAVLAAVLVAPALLRPMVVTLGSFAATLVGASTVVGGWHRPSDVIGALLVSLAWAAAVAVGVGTVHRPQTDGLGRSIGLALLGAAGAGVLLIGVGVRPSNGLVGLVDGALILGAIGVATAVTIGLYARIVPR